MKINIGTKSPAKINALKELLEHYPLLKDSEINAMSVESGINDQPKSFDETITGAKNRAKGAFKDCDLSFGIESGIMRIPYTKSGYLDFCCCVIFDGKDFHMGMSSGFEYPPKVIEAVEKDNINISEAFKKLGLTDEEYIGHTTGAVGLLTKGRVDRKEHAKQAIITAMIHLENKELY